MRLVRTPAETAHYVECRLYELQKVKDKQLRSFEFERIMELADITDAALKRELWMMLRDGKIGKPRAILKRPRHEHAI